MDLIGIGNYQDYPSNVFRTGCCCEACITKGCEQPLPPSSNAWNIHGTFLNTKPCRKLQLQTIIVSGNISRLFVKAL